MADRENKNRLDDTASLQQRRNDQTPESDELDIFATFNLLTKHAKKIKLAALISIVFMAGFYAIYISKSNKARYIRYQMEIGLHFEGISAQQYPNGKNFNPSDIVSPDVLKTVYEKNRLQAINFRHFVNAFSASYKNIHRVRVAVKPPKGEEGKQTEEEKLEMEKVLEIINPSQVIIYMDLNYDTESLKQLPSNVLESIIKDVPTIWSKKFKNQYLMLNIPNPLKIIGFEKLTAMGYGDIYEILSKNLNLFIEGVNAIKKRNVDLLNIRSGKHDLTLEEAFFYVQHNLTRQLSAWYSMPQSFGIYKDEKKRKAFLKKQHFDLEARQTLLRRNNKALGETLHKIRNPQGPVTAPSTDGASKLEKRAFPSDTDKQVASPTVDDSLLERIYRSGQASQNINIEYVQKLYDKHLDGVAKIATIEQEITMVEKDIEHLSRTVELISGKRKDALIKEIEIELVLLIEEYKKWINICIEIAEEKIEVESLKTGGIYTVVSPMERIYINPSSGKLLKKKFVLIPGFLITFVFLGYCISLILREGFNKYKKEHDET
jgi:hypothetical protein